MNPIVFALRHPITVMVAIATVVLGAGLAVTRMPADIFPDLNTPIIYVAQPYGGMDPEQMEGYITNYYEYHFLYITGIDHVESKNIQSVALMKLFFHPGTNMAQAMAETVNYVNRSRSFMPTGTVPPFIMRFDAGSVPVGYLVFESKTRSIGEIQDEALFRVRPMFASLPGVSAPPPFGGNQRTIVIKADAKRLQAYKLSPDEVVAAIAKGNQITPSGNIALAGTAPMVPVNTVVGKDIKELENIPIRLGTDPTVYVGDIGYAVDTQDVPSGYGLVNGKRSVYILVTKRADASTLAVVNEVKKNLPRMQAAMLLPDISVRFAFDQSPYVTRAMWGVGIEGLLGAALTGLMVILFLRDWRSVIVVVLNIPFALLGSVVALWLTGQTINLMTLGGLALAVGILVDEATVEVENIHTQFELRQEKLRPLIPSVLLRGYSTPVTGTLSGGLFGGGLNDNLGSFSTRSDLDLQLLLEFENLGLGNRARVHERQAENRLAVLELFKTQDRIAAEVRQAHAQVQSAAARVADAEGALKDAAQTAVRNIENLGQTQTAGLGKGDGKAILLVVRPQEAVAAVQALALAYADYYGAVADYDRAQFRLYHALGHPAEAVTASEMACPPPERARLGTPVPGG
jgi:hypothetical protein